MPSHDSRHTGPSKGLPKKPAQQGAILQSEEKPGPAISTDTSLRAETANPRSQKREMSPVTAAQEQSKANRPASELRAATDSLFCGIGQIMFGDKPITGAVFLGGLALASPLMAIGAAVGSCIGSLAAVAMRFDRSEIKQGLYGFNASLVGLATMVAFSPSVAACSLMVAGCVASTAITGAMRKSSIAHYTAPFVVSTWAAWAVGKALELSPSQLTSSLLPTINFDLFGTLHGMGQVLFQGSALVGLVFASGLFLSSRKAAVAGVLGALSAGAVATATGFSGAAIATGLLGYNAALSAIALKDKPAYAAVASLATLPLCALFGYLGAPALTAPFVLSTWLVSAIAPKAKS